MIPVILAWVAYCALFVRFLLHGLRIGNFITTALIIGALFILLVLWTVHHITKPSERVQQAADALKASGSSAPAPVPAADSGSVSFRVAGTTFDNSDGTSRQEILRHMKFGDPPWADNPEDLLVTIEEEDYEGNLAFAVLINGYQIGFVPKSHIRQVEKAQQNISTCYVSDVKITGGGTAEDGRELYYGCKITLDY